MEPEKFNILVDLVRLLPNTNIIVDEKTQKRLQELGVLGGKPK